MPEAHRESYRKPDPRVPELIEIGRDASHAVRRGGLSAHAHAGAYELCYIARGAVDWWVGGDLHHVAAGQLYLTRPDEAHGGVDDVLHPCDVYWLQFRLTDARPLPGAPRDAAVAIRDGFALLGRRRFAATPTTARCFVQLLEAQRRPRAWTPALSRGLLWQLLGGVLGDHEAAVAVGGGRDDAGLSPPIRRSLEWMNRNLDGDYRVADAAGVAGLGATQFHQRFLREVGLSPNDWRARHRVARAKELLRSGDRSITEIAFSLGFSSSQYFATTFRRLVGHTPAAYRRRYGA